MRPLGRFEDDDPVEEPTAPLPSMREERDLRLTGEDVDATKAGSGECCRGLGVKPVAPAALTSMGSLLVVAPSPFC